MTTGIMMRLEQMCNMVDAILAGHGLAAQVAGGYLTGDGLLLSLTDTTFLNTQIQHELRSALHVDKVLATVGVVLVNGWLQRPSADNVIEGEYVEVKQESLTDVETVDLLDLIAEHQGEVKQGIPAKLPPITVQ